jgi:hypothetical protein
LESFLTGRNFIADFQGARFPNVRAGLPAKAPVQLMNMSTDPQLSLASQLLQGAV